MAGVDDTTAGITDGTGPEVLNTVYMQLTMTAAAQEATLISQMRAKRKVLTWKDLVLAGIFQSLECTDLAELRTRLSDTIILLESWVEELDSRAYKEVWDQTQPAAPAKKRTGRKKRTGT